MFKVLNSYIHSELIFTSLYKFRSNTIVVQGIVSTYIERELGWYVNSDMLMCGQPPQACHMSLLLYSGEGVRILRPTPSYRVV